MDEAAHFFQLFFSDELQRIEILDFGGDLAGKLGRIKLGYPCHSAFTGEQVLPHFFRGVAHGADEPYASNYDPTSQLLPAFRVLADVIHGVLHGADLFRVFVGDFNFNFSLQRFIAWNDDHGGVGPRVHDAGISADRPRGVAQLVRSVAIVFLACIAASADGSAALPTGG